MSDIENDYHSDQEVSKDHKKLLQSVTKLDKAQRVKKPERSEPTLAVSEFHLVKSGVSDNDVVNVNDLVGTLKGKSHHRLINKKFEFAKKSAKVLPKPLEKPAADKLKREVHYQNNQKVLQKWDAVVTKNRTADTLHFPLNQPSLRMQTTDKFVERFRLQSELEKELAALEPEKKIVETIKDDFPMTLAEIREKRKEAAKFRVQQSYQAAKAMRQNKIKSKKYHRVQRKALIKQQLKEFEQLQKTDPEAALEKLQHLDKVRAEERMSLRHKNSGQWAKNKMIRAKYDKDSRQALAQQLSISRELTQKVKKNDSDDEEIEYEPNSRIEEADKENPFFKSTSEIDAFVTQYRKYSDEKNKEKENKNVVNIFPVPEVPEIENSVKEVIEKEENSLVKNHQSPKKKIIKKIKKNLKIKKEKVGTTEWSVEVCDDVKPVLNLKPLDLDNLFDNIESNRRKNINKKIKKVKRKLNQAVNYKDNFDDEKKNESDNEYSDLSFKKTKLRPEFDGLDETIGDAELQPLKKQVNENITFNEPPTKKNKVEIDPTKFINAKPKHLKTMLPDDVTGGDEGLDDSEDEETFKKDQHKIISEAFADDDVVDDFNREKEEEIKKTQPEDLNMVLPGWGSWTGKNIEVPKRKKSRFIMKFPKEAPRRDENKGDVIIIEGGNQKIRNHLVSDLPYPFESVADFEASIRAPIGRNFVPENAHKRLIEPAVKTKMGKIIEPMDEESLVQKDRKIRGQIPESIVLKNKKKKMENKAIKKISNFKNNSNKFKKSNSNVNKT